MRQQFFINGANGSVGSEYFCLGVNQSASFPASQFDPGATGYVVAVAVDSATGCPVSHNFLIGDAYFKLTTATRQDWREVNSFHQRSRVCIAAMPRAPLVKGGLPRIALFQLQHLQ